MLWRECPKNAWLKVHKPEFYYASKLTEFEQSIIDSGVEVEEVTRSLFPGGRLVEGRGEEALQTTQVLLAEGKSPLFQPIFEGDGFVAAVDVLEYDIEADCCTILEIKSSSQAKEQHLYDVAFQTLLLRRCGLKIERVFIVHLNSEYVR